MVKPQYFRFATFLSTFFLKRGEASDGRGASANGAGRKSHYPNIYSILPPLSRQFREQAGYPVSIQSSLKSFAFPLALSPLFEFILKPNDSFYAGDAAINALTR